MLQRIIRENEVFSACSGSTNADNDTQLSLCLYVSLIARVAPFTLITAVHFRYMDRTSLLMDSCEISIHSCLSPSWTRLPHSLDAQYNFKLAFKYNLKADTTIITLDSDLCIKLILVLKCPLH